MLVDQSKGKTLTGQQPSLKIQTGPAPIPRDARLFLLFLSEINLVIGALFYVYPDISISLWPWMVKPLAIRFFGAIFLAITFGCWAALRARAWQRAKILLLVGGTFFGITSIVSLGQVFTPYSPTTIWVWTMYFGASAIGCLALLSRHGWSSENEKVSIKDSVPSLARFFFGFQTLIVGFFGVIMLLTPDIAQAQFWPWHVAKPTLQAFAGLFLATCLATGWASFQKNVLKVKVLLPLDIIFPSLALLAVGIHWNVISSETPGALVTGVWVFVYSFVAVGSTILFLTTRSKTGTSY